MAKLEYEYPIKTVRGKLKDKFGASKRKEANNKGKQEPFSVIYGERTAPVTQAEMAHRTRFATLSAMVKARKTDQTKRAADQAGFKAQTAIKTLKAYIWSKAKAELDAEE